MVLPKFKKEFERMIGVVDVSTDERRLSLLVGDDSFFSGDRSAASFSSSSLICGDEMISSGTARNGMSSKGRANVSLSNSSVSILIFGLVLEFSDVADRRSDGGVAVLVTAGVVGSISSS